MMTRAVWPSWIFPLIRCSRSRMSPSAESRWCPAIIARLVFPWVFQRHTCPVPWKNRGAQHWLDTTRKPPVHHRQRGDDLVRGPGTRLRKDPLNPLQFLLQLVEGGLVEKAV